MINPLRKTSSAGATYRRTAKIESSLEQLLSLEPHVAVDLCGIRVRSDPDFVASECVVHLLRASRCESTGLSFDRLFPICLARLRARFPRPEFDGGVVLEASRIRDLAVDRFVEMLVRDRSGYVEALDYYEVRFDGAVATLRLDAQRPVWRDGQRTTALKFDGASGELLPEIERAAGSLDHGRDDAGFHEERLADLHEAIASLPAEQARIVEMLLQEMPIDAKDPSVVTIARVLRRTERTIRAHRDRAFASLRRRLDYDVHDERRRRSISEGARGRSGPSGRPGSSKSAWVAKPAVRRAAR